MSAFYPKEVQFKLRSQGETLSGRSVFRQWDRNYKDLVRVRHLGHSGKAHVSGGAQK
jgi:hypothetical protein